MSLEVFQRIHHAHDAPITRVTYDAHENTISSGDERGVVKTHHARNGELAHAVDAHRGHVTALCWCESRRCLVSGGVDGTVAVWSDRGKLAQRVDLRRGPIASIGFGERRAFVAVGGLDGALHLYVLAREPKEPAGAEEAATKRAAPALAKVASIVDVHADAISACVFSRDCNKLFTASHDRSIAVFPRVSTADPRRDVARRLNAHDAAITQLDLDAENNWLVTGGMDGATKVFTTEGKPLASYRDDAIDHVVASFYQPASATYWSLGGGGELAVFDPKTPMNVTELLRRTSRFAEFPVVGLTQSPDHPGVVLGVMRSRAKHDLVAWRYNPSAAFRVYGDAHDDWIERLVVVPSKPGEPEEICSASCDGGVKRWRSAGGDATSTDAMSVFEELRGHRGAVLCATYCDSLGVLVTGGEDGTVRLFEIRDRGLEGEVAHSHVARGVDGDGDAEDLSGSDREYGGDVDSEDETSTAAAATSAGVVAKWDARSTASEAKRNFDGDWNELRGHRGKVTAVCEAAEFVLVTAGDDGTLRTWDLRRRREVHCVEDPHGGAEVHAVVAGARERAEFATAAADAVVKIWHVDDEGRREMMKGELVGHTDHVTALEWCEWRALWITASDDHTIRLWRADTRASIRCVSVRTEGEGVTTMTLDPVCECLVAAGRDMKIRVFDVDRLEGVAREGADAAAADADADADGAEVDVVMETTQDGVVKVSIDDPKAPHPDDVFGGAAVDANAVPRVVYAGHVDQIKSIVRVNGKSQYASAGCDKTIRAWLAPDHPGRRAGKRKVKKTADDDGLAGDGASAFERENPLRRPAMLGPRDVDPAPPDADGSETPREGSSVWMEMQKERAREEKAHADALARVMMSSLGRKLHAIEAEFAAEYREKAKANA